MFQIFRPASPSSPSHDPFMTSPSTSRSHPHLRGSSRSPSPPGTPPFPGPGIDSIPDTVGGLGVLFAEEEEDGFSSQPTVPNPYAASSSSDEEIEPELDQIAEVRRSLRQPLSERAKKGWIAHHSVFPPSSSSSASESDKDTEAETDDEPAPSSDLREPLLGHQEERSSDTIPARLQVYHGRFGHWEREGLRKHKGGSKGPLIFNGRRRVPSALAIFNTWCCDRVVFRVGTNRCEPLAGSSLMLGPHRSPSLKTVPDTTPSSSFCSHPTCSHLAAVIPSALTADGPNSPARNSSSNTVVPICLRLVGVRC